MPIIPENVKRYFENLKCCVQGNIFNEKISNSNLKDMEINGLFPDQFVDQGLRYIDEEFTSIQSIPKDIMKRSPVQSMKSLELIGAIYQLHGVFRKELDILRYYQKLSDIKQCLEDKNFGLASEAFWHMLHDNKTVISLRSVELCKKIVINEHSKKQDHRFFIVDLAKIMFKTINPEYEELFESIEILRTEYHSYFAKSSLDSYLSRALISYYTFIVKIKAERLNKYSENFNHLEMGQVMRKVALKVLEHLKTKNSNVHMLNGSYEILFYMWTFVNILLESLHIVSEVTTIMGVERDAKQYQYEYFRTSLTYCVPYRTKSAVKLMMHNEFINQRIPELTIRDAQLYFLKTNDSTATNSLQGSYCCQTIEIDEMDEFNLPLTINDANDFDFFFSNGNKKKETQNPHCLYITSSSEGEKCLNLEDCFLSKSMWKVEFLDILKVIRAYIWKVDSCDTRFSDDIQWENLFSIPKDDDDQLAKDFKDSVTLITPENSPTKLDSRRKPYAAINAPIRVQRRQLQVGPTKIKKVINKQTNKENVDDEDDVPIDSCSTVVIPYKARNIRYEIPELPRSIHYKAVMQDGSLLSSPTAAPGGQLVVDYLQKHMNIFKFLHIPVLHRPIFQRLALHYLSLGDHVKAAYNFSMAINIGFRQSYQYDCNLKIRLKNEDSPRWTVTSDIVSHCLTSEINLHAIVRNILPNNWTVLQFTMIDEIQISKIKSSLLDGDEGGCLGARNVAVMVATKYQKCNGVLDIANRVIHGFKSTGLQLMEHFEKLKMDNIQSLNIREKRQWWKKRYEIDGEINCLVNQMRKDWLTESDLNWLLDNENSCLASEPKIIITDRHLGRLPWECIFREDETVPRCLSRMPNLICLVAHLSQIRFRKVSRCSQTLRRVNLEVDPCNAFFLVNPDSTLQSTEDTLLPMFKEKLKWDGVSGHESSSMNCAKILNSKDMTIYCGHGSGSRYLSDKLMKQITSPSAMFLIGCYSARFIVEGRSEALSLMMGYLNNGCPSVMGLLWDVTDREIDKFTQQMFVAWLTKRSSFALNSDTYVPVAPLAAYLNCKDTSHGLRLQTLTGKSSILYGLPIWVDSKSPVPNLCP